MLRPGNSLASLASLTLAGGEDMTLGACTERVTPAPCPMDHAFKDGQSARPVLHRLEQQRYWLHGRATTFGVISITFGSHLTRDNKVTKRGSLSA